MLTRKLHRLRRRTHLKSTCLITRSMHLTKIAPTKARRCKRCRNEEGRVSFVDTMLCIRISFFAKVWGFHFSYIHYWFVGWMNNQKESLFYIAEDWMIPAVLKLVMSRSLVDCFCLHVRVDPHVWGRCRSRSFGARSQHISETYTSPFTQLTFETHTNSSCPQKLMPLRQLQSNYSKGV